MLRDRGNQKWQPVMFMPEQSKMMRDMYQDLMKSDKPELDESQIEEMENRICHAMEFTVPVIITVWTNGYLENFQGFIHRINEITKEIYLEPDEGERNIERLPFQQIVEIVLLD